MKKIIVVILLIVTVFASENVFSQNVTVKGNVNSYNALVRLFLYNDMLTLEQTQVAETHADDNGDFLLEVDLDIVSLAQIAVNLERVDILLSPNAEYDIEIILPEQSDETSYFERETPVIKMKDAKDEGLYYQYLMTESIIDNFIVDNFNRLYRGRQLSLLDSLDIEIEKKLGMSQLDFIKDYVRYKKASVQMAVDNDNAKRVVNQYFNKQKVLYSQPAYMALFNEIFTDYLLSRQFEPSEFFSKFYSGYDIFLTYLKNKDVFLSDNEDLAELIIAWNLRRMYYENPDDRKLTMTYLDKIIQLTDNEDNKLLIKDILKQINRLSYGSQAPDFLLNNKNGETVKLSDFQDNMLLLQFVSNNSSMIDYHFDKLKELSLQWQDSVKIVTIATKESFDDFKQMFDNKSIKWDLLNLDDDILLLEKYQIRTFPDYIIIRKGGKIGMAPAPAPDQYLDYHVRRIYKYL